MLVNKCSKCNDKGGVAILVQEGLPSSEAVHATLQDVEALAVNIQHPQIGPIDIGHSLIDHIMFPRASSFQDVTHFFRLIITVIEVVAGDFNVDLTKEGPLINQISHNRELCSGYNMPNTYIRISSRPYLCQHQLCAIRNTSSILLRS